MGLLPCLRRGSDRWCLPCSLQATEVLAELLLRSQQGQPLTTATRRRVHRAILTDPPLMIYASLASTADRVEPMQLVDWLADHILERIASGDAYLGQPAITAAIARRWNRLRDHFRTLPIQRWLDDAALWLEVTGPKVSAAWKQQWPTVCQDEDLAEAVDAYDVLQERYAELRAMFEAAEQSGYTADYAAADDLAVTLNEAARDLLDVIVAAVKANDLRHRILEAHLCGECDDAKAEL